VSDDRTEQAASAGTTPTEGDERFVTLGRVSGAHGIQGWIKIRSETSPRENIVNYSPWHLLRNGRREVWKVKAGRLQGKAVVAKLEGCDDRNLADALVGAEIMVPRSMLPEITTVGEFYWADLVGLTVRTVEGVELGRIDRLFETGSNDVMVVQGDRERLVPYIWEQVVRDVDLQAGTMLVDWDPDF